MQPEIQIENSLLQTLEGFTTMDDSTLEATRVSLGLSISAAELRACRNYYRNTVHRDPREEEIFFLDRLVSSLCHIPANLFVTEMKTESDLMAEIFADMMARRRAVNADLDRPASLAEMADMINSYLAIKHADGRGDRPVGVGFSRHRDLALSSDGYRVTASTGNEATDISIGVKIPQNTADTVVKNGDYVFAILDTDYTSSDFETELADFLAEGTVSRACKKMIPLAGRGVFQGLLGVADGFSVKASAWLNEDEPLSSLTAPVCGILLVAAPSVAADMLLLAGERGFRMVRVATVTGGKLIRISAAGGEFSFHSHFLRSLILPRAYSVTLPTPSADTAKLFLHRIGTCTVGGKKHSVVKVDAVGSDPFFSSVNGMIYAALNCIAAGAESEKIRLFTHFQCSRPTPTKVARILSMVLAFYRVQAEMEWEGNTPSFTEGKADDPSCSVVAVAPLSEKIIPSLAEGGGTDIFYLEPLFADNGLVDFGDFKKMLAYIRRTVQGGHVLSMMPTSGDLLADLERMSRNTTVEYLLDRTLPSRVGGVLIESDIPLEGVLVARTEAPVCEEKEQELPSDADELAES